MLSGAGEIGYARSVTALQALALLLVSPTSPAVVDLGDGRYRATIVYRGSDVRAATQAQLRLHAVAQRHCRGRGEALSEGLEVGRGPRRNQVSLSETFTCLPR